MARMLELAAVPRPNLPGDRPVPTPIWVITAVVGWAFVAVLGVGLFARNPPQAGMDLQVLLDAGARVASGLSPYDQSLLSGHWPAALELYYYPPPFAQLLSLVAGFPLGAVLVAWAVAAVAGVGAVAVALARTLDRRRVANLPSAVRTAGVPAVGLIAFVFPFVIAILFGNADAIFPFAYGLMLLGALADRPAARFAAGASLAIVSIAKVHPASLGLWFLVRGLAAVRVARAGRDEPSLRARGLPAAWRVLIAAAVVGLGVVAASLLAGGLTPWQVYFDVLGAGSTATLIDTRNIGPAGQIAALLGGGETLAHALQVLFSVAALAVTAWAAWSRRDPIESFAWASAASLVTLPITWFHYPIVLLPVAIASALRAAPGRPRTRVLLLLAGAMVVAAVSIVLPVTVWLAVGLVLLVAVASAEAPEPAADLEPDPSPDPSSRQTAGP